MFRSPTLLTGPGRSATKLVRARSQRPRRVKMAKQRPSFDLSRVETSLRFIEQNLEGDSLESSKLEDLDSFAAVAELAKSQGYEIDHTSFAEAMKITVDQSLERAGVPSWIRYRVNAPVHD